MMGKLLRADSWLRNFLCADCFSLVSEQRWYNYTNFTRPKSQCLNPTDGQKVRWMRCWRWRAKLGEPRKREWKLQIGEARSFVDDKNPEIFEDLTFDRREQPEAAQPQCAHSYVGKLGKFIIIMVEEKAPHIAASSQVESLTLEGGQETRPTRLIVFPWTQIWNLETNMREEIQRAKLYIHSKCKVRRGRERCRPKRRNLAQSLVMLSRVCL